MNIDEILYRNGLFHWTQIPSLHSQSIDGLVAKIIMFNKEFHRWCYLKSLGDKARVFYKNIKH